MKSVIRFISSFFKKWYPLILLVCVWEFVSRTKMVDPFYLPPFSISMKALFEGLFINGDIWLHIEMSLFRAIAGLVSSIIAGTVIGLLMARYTPINNFLDPLISIIFPTPKLALFPILIFWFGIGQTSKILLIAMTCFFPVVVNTYAGVKNVDKYLIWNAITKGASGTQILQKVILPAAMPFIFTGIRVASSFAFILIVASEMIAANDGLGFFIIAAERTFNSDVMFAGIILIGILGFGFDRFILYLQRRLFVWRDTGEERGTGL
jgi:ABC-type nitrate/sulfonate/bicarbonate transport system permease component